MAKNNDTAIYFYLFFRLPQDVPYEQLSELFDPYLNKQKMCQQWTENNENNLATNKTQWPFHSANPKPKKPSTNQQLLTPELQHLKEAQRCVQRSATSVKKISLLREIDEQCQENYLDGNIYSMKDN